MKTIWGLLLIGCGLMMSQLAQAKEWTPFFGVSLLPNMNAVYSEFDSTAHQGRTAQLNALYNGSLIIRAGIENGHWSILAGYYITSMPHVWASLDDPPERPNSLVYIIDTYEFKEWNEYHLSCGARYFPATSQPHRSRLFLGAGIGFGRVVYKEIHTRLDRHGEEGNSWTVAEAQAESWYFFKQYGEVGISTKLSKDFNMIVGFTLQHAMVPLDRNKLNPYIHNNVENWVAAFEVGILYYFR
jgi:hypothetical protein